jgi:hypothetical protein
MLDAMIAGKMGPAEGWFRPGRGRLDWKWLAGRFDRDRDGAVGRAEFRGPAAFFDRLDRDGDGTLTAADFDWSPQSPRARQDAQIKPWFSQADRDSNGRISRAEWDRLFNRLAGERDHLTPEELRQLLFPPAARAARGGGRPPRDLMLARLFANELGSPYEGPRIGQPAPRFTLRTHDGVRTVALADCLGEKPVVLIFGSFT